MHTRAYSNPLLRPSKKGYPVPTALELLTRPEVSIWGVDIVQLSSEPGPSLVEGH